MTCVCPELPGVFYWQGIELYDSVPSAAFRAQRSERSVPALLVIGSREALEKTYILWISHTVTSISRPAEHTSFSPRVARPLLELEGIKGVRPVGSVCENISYTNSMAV
jgi:hypothetical protein